MITIPNILLLVEDKDNDRKKKTPIKEESDNANTTIAINDEITLAQLSLRRLALARQIRKVRSDRRISNTQHADLVGQCKDRMTIAGKRFNSIIHGTSTLNIYLSVARELYNNNPVRYVVHLHAKLLQCSRTQEVLESYVSMAKCQYDSIIWGLRETHHDMLVELQDERCQVKDQEYLIQEQMVVLVTTKMKAYYESRQPQSNSQHLKKPPTLIQRVIRRKASERSLMLTALSTQARKTHIVSYY